MPAAVPTWRRKHAEYGRTGRRIDNSAEAWAECQQALLMAAVRAVHPGHQHFVLGVLSSLLRQASDWSPVLRCCQDNTRCMCHS